ncbi:MAG: B12-binding domain-containing radical SAM protein [Candidatus Omnitrophica bacterium]|nr:B12-binding domain-containing radical SAM protein [Candidatus Omnitrophota bacterium]
MGNTGQDVVLVKPGGRVETFGGLSQFSGFAPPLDIGLLAAYLRAKGFSVSIIDADAEFLTPEETAGRIIEKKPFLVGIFAHTLRMSHASKTLHLLKEAGSNIRTLLGGRHPSALPERTLKEEQVDFVCQGEPYLPIEKLLSILRKNRQASAVEIEGLWFRQNDKVVHNPPAPLISELDSLPMIAWDLLPMQRYRAHNWQCLDNLSIRGPYSILYTSIGCPFGCSYCVVNAVYGRPIIRLRSPERVIEDFNCLVNSYQVRYLRITDDLFTFKTKRVLDICERLAAANSGINIWVYARVDTVNYEVLKAMKAAGIRWVCYGIESGQEEVRQGVRKNFDRDKIFRAVEMTYKAGIHIIANYIFGLPEDNQESMQATLDMAEKLNCEYANFYTAMAWPGSQLYYEAINRQIRMPETWQGYSPLAYETLPLPTKHLTASQVLEFRDLAFNHYFSRKTYQDMLAEKFGQSAVEHVQRLLQKKIKRKYVEEIKLTQYWQ